MAYWCDDYGLFVQQRRLDAMQARMKRKAEEKRANPDTPTVSTQYEQQER